MRDLKFISILSGSCIGHFITKFVQINLRNMNGMNLTDLIMKMFPGGLDVFPPLFVSKWSNKELAPFPTVHQAAGSLRSQSEISHK